MRAERRKWSVVGPALVLLTVVIMVVATVMGASVLTARPNEVVIASPETTALADEPNALSAQIVSVQLTAGGTLVSFPDNGQAYDLQANSVGEVTPVQSVSQVSVQGANPALSSGLTNGPGVITPPPGGGGGPTLYLVTFDESGLPSGTSWSVAVVGTDYNLTSLGTVGGSPVGAYLQNGTYDYQPLATNYTATAGTFTVAGAVHTVEITFTKPGSDPSCGASGSSGTGWWKVSLSQCLTQSIVGILGGSALTIAGVCLALGVTVIGGIACTTVIGVIGLIIGPIEIADGLGGEQGIYAEVWWGIPWIAPN